MTDNTTQPQSVPLGGVNPPQFQALSQETMLVSVGIGGNDADLVGIAESCVAFDALSPTRSPCRNHYTVNGRDSAPSDRLGAPELSLLAPYLGAGE